LILPPRSSTAPPTIARFPQLLEETRHFFSWRQKQVAKIVHCGEPKILNKSKREGHPQEWPLVFCDMVCDITLFSSLAWRGEHNGRMKYFRRCRHFLTEQMNIERLNKRARKRLKEAIEKKNLECQKMLKEQSSASSQPKERRGFTVKPEKKHG